MSVEYDEYKGHPIIVLKADDNDEYSFKFGVSKAKLILEHLDDIRQFVEDNE